MPSQFEINSRTPLPGAKSRSLFRDSYSDAKNGKKALGVDGSQDSFRKAQLRAAHQELFLVEKNSSLTKSSLSKANKAALKKYNRLHLQNQTGQVRGVDPKYFNDEENYYPNTDYSVTLDFRKEFIRHKRVICSIKEFNNFDIQNKWDIGYCRAFCQNELLDKSADPLGQQSGVGVAHAVRDMSAAAELRNP